MSCCCCNLQASCRPQDSNDGRTCAPTATRQRSSLSPPTQSHLRSPVGVGHRHPAPPVPDVSDRVGRHVIRLGELRQG
eukprot:760403-Hanusia_phi.AAC.7